MLQGKVSGGQDGRLVGQFVGNINIQVATHIEQELAAYEQCHDGGGREFIWLGQSSIFTWGCLVGWLACIARDGQWTYALETWHLHWAWSVSCNQRGYVIIIPQSKRRVCLYYNPFQWLTGSNLIRFVRVFDSVFDVLPHTRPPEVHLKWVAVIYCPLLLPRNIILPLQDSLPADVLSWASQKKRNQEEWFITMETLSLSAAVRKDSGGSAVFK